MEKGYIEMISSNLNKIISKICNNMRIAKGEINKWSICVQWLKKMLEINWVKEIQLATRSQQKQNQESYTKWLSRYVSNQ